MATPPLLAHSIYATLKERIVTFQLKPGDALQEVQLAEVFNVSRTPIREALRMLTREGLVELLPRQGARVAVLSIKDLLDAYEVRLYLEPPAIRKAAHNITPDAVAQMAALIESGVD